MSAWIGRTGADFIEENHMTRTTLPSIRVWDAPVRVFHWLLALSFAGAWLTAESARWRLVHVSTATSSSQRRAGPTQTTIEEPDPMRILPDDDVLLDDG